MKYLVSVMEKKYKTEICSFEFSSDEIGEALIFAGHAVKRVSDGCSIFLEKVEDDEK